MIKTIAIFAAKLTRLLSKAIGNNATALPGLVAERIDPNILEKIVKGNFKQGIVVVTGTNGKTTTSKIIVDALRAEGIKVLNNKAGSNLYRGIVATIISNSNIFGHNNDKMAVFEVDEAHVEKVCMAIQPSHIVVTNLFRDQLDRYGELNSIKNRFDKTFRKLKSTLILNADDPLVASLANSSDKKSVYFGISQYNGPVIYNDHAADSIFDPITNEKLNYLQRYFGHIGIYKSISGDYKRPKPDINVKLIKKIDAQGSSFVIDIDRSQIDVKTILAGLYNIYNIIAAASVLNCFGISAQNISNQLKSLGSAFGRGEELLYKNKKVKMLLVKNPTGFNQIIQTYLKTRSQSVPLLICINDKIADGRDVSWLWDVAIEDISSYKGKIIVCGTRAYDMALRLKYAGMTNFVIEQDYTLAIDAFLKQIKSKSQGYILPTYTAMLELRKIITSKNTPKTNSEVWK